MRGRRQCLLLLCLVVCLGLLVQTSVAGKSDVDPGRRLKTVGTKTDDLEMLPLYMLLNGSRETAQCTVPVVLLAAAVAILSIMRIPLPSTKK